VVVKRERAARIYIGAVMAAGALALALGSLTVDPDRFDVTMFVFLAVLAGVAQRLPVFLFRNSAISVSFAATIATYVIFGTGIALWVNLVAAAVNAFTPRRKSLERIGFNSAALTLSAFVAGVTYTAIGGRTAPMDVLPTVLAVAISGSAYFVVNSVLVAGVITLTTESRFAVIWRENYSWMAVNWVATSMNGASLALAYQAISIFGALAFVMPLAVAWYSFKLFMAKSREVRRRNEELQTLNAALEQTTLKLQESHVSIVGALVGALEAKDQYTHGHAAATMFHAVATAKKLGLSDEDTATVQLAALFHDIGKIGVAEQILRKPGPLGYTEWSEVKDHTRIGANMLAKIPSLALVRPAVLGHHERWDGSGYPDQLKGEDIPLAARVVAVCDAYQAMISKRPYRPARTREQALAELVRSAGTQFDPRIVEAFVANLQDEFAAQPAALAQSAPSALAKALEAPAW
jgi:putative nucleotidyltransferase with HDIG domain